MSWAVPTRRKIALSSSRALAVTMLRLFLRGHRRRYRPHRCWAVRTRLQWPGRPSYPDDYAGPRRGWPGGARPGPTRRAGCAGGRCRPWCYVHGGRMRRRSTRRHHAGEPHERARGRQPAPVHRPLWRWSTSPASSCPRVTAATPPITSHAATPTNPAATKPKRSRLLFVCQQER